MTLSQLLHSLLVKQLAILYCVSLSFGIPAQRLFQLKHKSLIYMPSDCAERCCVPAIKSSVNKYHAFIFCVGFEFSCIIILNSNLVKCNPSKRKPKGVFWLISPYFLSRVKNCLLFPYPIIGVWHKRVSNVIWGIYCFKVITHYL